MKIEKKLLKISLSLILLSTLTLAGPAFPGVKIFTQPDGTQFEGVLKGTASFHWIESDGAIVKINNEDKYYYIAVVDANGSLRLTNEKPVVKMDGISFSSSKDKKNHNISIEDRKKLNKVPRNNIQGVNIK